MFSDEEIKESCFLRPGDELISIREVCLSDKFDKKDFTIGNEPLLPSSGRNDLDVPRLFRDFDGLDQQQARFAWTEEDGNIASLVSEPGFGTGHTFGKDLEVELKTEMKEADTSSCQSTPRFTTNRHGMTFSQKPYVEPNGVSSTSAAGSGSDRKSGSVAKVDKTDPRSRFHYVKYVKRNGRTVKLWECGICTREFQHQYTLMRHLPTHTDERNFHCSECGKSFRQLSTLSQHRAIHSADRPYSCEVCNKTFNRVSTLISHRKTHSDEKPYRCHMCPKGFHQKGNLRNHLFTHTNERPYRCNICLKGFNQQSNLVCHKNKAHPDNISPNASASNTPIMSRQNSDITPDSTRSSIDCEVTSSMGPCLPSAEPSTSWHTPSYSRSKRDTELWNEGSWSSGVIVDPIKTYHMGVALATKQTPFALLKPENAAPVLVKVVDTKMPNGKQMLVPATAEDLRVGGKIVMNNDNSSANQSTTNNEAANMVQIRVPVVATVVPRMNAGRLQLAVEEPHHAYHTALSNQGQSGTRWHPPSCSAKGKHPAVHATTSTSMLRTTETRRIDLSAFEESPKRGVRMSSASLPPPTPSPPLDLIPMDLFEPMECIPLGPQITAVDSIDDEPQSDDSDIFIGKFEDSIQLSDSD